MRIEIIPCREHNYAYALVNERSREAVVFDPSEAEPVERFLDREGVRLRQIWMTHHHWDHVGGIAGLLASRDDVPVLGSAYDLDRRRIPMQSAALVDGDVLEFAGEHVRVMHVPGHTLGALAYVMAGNVFTGDTLFLAGCGRMFEGTAEMMVDSLERLRALPDETRVWCGHEFTVRNLEFAQTIEPDNAAVTQRLEATRQVRRQGHPTVPGTMSQERETNVFLRCDVPSVARGRTAPETFAAIRAAKDRF